MNEPKAPIASGRRYRVTIAFSAPKVGEPKSFKYPISTTHPLEVTKSEDGWLIFKVLYGDREKFEISEEDFVAVTEPMI